MQSPWLFQLELKKAGKWNEIIQEIEEITELNPRYLDAKWKRSLGIQWIFGNLIGVPIPEAEARLQFFRGEGIPAFFSEDESEEVAFWAALDYLAECLLAYFLKKLDSLEGLLMNWDQETRVFDDPNERVWLDAIAGILAIKTSFDTRAYYWLENAYEMSASRGWKFIEAIVAEKLSEYLVSRNNHKKAHLWITKAINAYEDLDDRYPIARLYNMLGTISLELQDPENANIEFSRAHQAVSEIEEESDKRFRIETAILTNLARAHFALGDTDSSINYALRAEKTMELTSALPEDKVTLSIIATVMFLEKGDITEAERRLDLILNDPMFGTRQPFKYQTGLLHSLIELYKDNLGNAETLSVEAHYELTKHIDWEEKIRVECVKILATLRRYISRAEKEKIIEILPEIKDLANYSANFMESVAIQFYMLLSRLNHLLGNETQAKEAEAKVKQILSTSTDEQLKNIIPAYWKTSPEPLLLDSFALFQEAIKLLKALLFKQSPRVIFGGGEHIKTPLRIEVALFGMSDIGPVCLAHTFHWKDFVEPQENEEEDLSSSIEEARKREAQVAIETMLTQMSIHLTVALGQGASYHKGFYGPLPTVMDPYGEVLALTFVRPDLSAEDERIRKNSYSVLAVFYDSTQDVYRLRSRKQLRDKLQELVDVDWTTKKDLSEWVQEVKSVLLDFL